MLASDPRFLAVYRTSVELPKDAPWYQDELRLPANRIKSFLKRWPKFYNFLQWFLSPAYSLATTTSTRKVLVRVFGDSPLGDKIILNLGSGTKRIHPEIINVDIHPFKNVDVVADIKELPFEDGSCDLVVLDSVLEHIPDAAAVVSEITRIVKPSGYLFVTVPFLYPFHASPNDYYRWTRAGIEESFKSFSRIEAGLRAGPMAALQGILMHIFGLLLCFGSERLYILFTNIGMVVFSPLKLLDAVFRLVPQSHEVAADIYFLGQKVSR